VNPEINAQIVADVHHKIANRPLAIRPGRMGVGAVPAVVPAVVLAFVPQAVQVALDMTVQAVGKPIEALAEAEKENIRTFVSNSTLKFLDGLIQGLEDAPTGQ
jgi:hypothetical protein